MGLNVHFTTAVTVPSEKGHYLSDCTGDRTGLDVS